MSKFGPALWILAVLNMLTISVNPCGETVIASFTECRQGNVGACALIVGYRIA